MPTNPTVRDVHVDQALTNIAIAYLQDPENFFASQVFPSVPVNNKSNRYHVWKRGDMNRDKAQITAPGDSYPIGRKRLSQDNYNCDVYKYSEMIADEERENADSALDLDEAAVATVMNVHRIRMDRAFVDAYVQPSIWTGSTTAGDITPTTKWDDPAGTPVQDIKAQVRSLQRRGISRQNMKLVCGPNVFDTLTDSPQFLERYENVMAAILNEDLLAAVLGIGQVLVAESVYASNDESNEPTDSDTIDEFIFPDDVAVLLYCAPSPGINVPTAGYTFAWTGLGGMGIEMGTVRHDDKDADQIKGRMSWDMKLVASELGVYFNDVLSP